MESLRPVQLNNADFDEDDELAFIFDACDSPPNGPANAPSKNMLSSALSCPPNAPPRVTGLVESTFSPPKWAGGGSATTCALPSTLPVRDGPRAQSFGNVTPLRLRSRDQSSWAPLLSGTQSVALGAKPLRLARDGRASCESTRSLPTFRARVTHPQDSRSLTDALQQHVSRPGQAALDSQSYGLVRVGVPAQRNPGSFSPKAPLRRPHATSLPVCGQPPRSSLLARDRASNDAAAPRRALLTGDAFWRAFEDADSRSTTATTLPVLSEAIQSTSTTLDTLSGQSGSNDGLDAAPGAVLSYPTAPASGVPAEVSPEAVHSLSHAAFVHSLAPHALQQMPHATLSAALHAALVLLESQSKTPETLVASPSNAPATLAELGEPADAAAAAGDASVPSRRASDVAPPSALTRRHPGALVSHLRATQRSSSDYVDIARLGAFGSAPSPNRLSEKPPQTGPTREDFAMAHSLSAPAGDGAADPRSEADGEPPDAHRAAQAHPAPVESPSSARGQQQVVCFTPGASELPCPPLTGIDIARYFAGSDLGEHGCFCGGVCAGCACTAECIASRAFAAAPPPDDAPRADATGSSDQASLAPGDSPPRRTLAEREQRAARAAARGLAGVPSGEVAASGRLEGLPPQSEGGSGIGGGEGSKDGEAMAFSEEWIGLVAPGVGGCESSSSSASPLGTPATTAVLA